MKLDHLRALLPSLMLLLPGVARGQPSSFYQDGFYCESYLIYDSPNLSITGYSRTLDWDNSGEMMEAETYFYDPTSANWDDYQGYNYLDGYGDVIASFGVDDPWLGEYWVQGEHWAQEGEEGWTDLGTSANYYYDNGGPPGEESSVFSRSGEFTVLFNAHLLGTVDYGNNDHFVTENATAYDYCWWDGSPYDYQLGTGYSSWNVNSWPVNTYGLDEIGASGPDTETVLLFYQNQAALGRYSQGGCGFEGPQWMYMDYSAYPYDQHWSGLHIDPEDFVVYRSNAYMYVEPY